MDHGKKKYIRWGVTIFIVIAASIALAISLARIATFASWLRGVARAFSPLAWGLAIAYVLNPVAVFVEEKMLSIFTRKRKSANAPKIAHALGVTAAMLTALLVIFAVIMLIVPQLINSVTTFADNGKTYYNNVETWVTNQLENTPNLRNFVENLLSRIYESMTDWMENRFLSSMQSLMSMLGTGIYSVITSVLNFLIGLIVATYMLAGKQRYLAQMRKANAALWRPHVAERFLDVARHANQVFGGFIRGKLLDSAVIGVLCYIGVAILRMPYSILVATIIGITNIIPFFGPIIGAVPCALLILLVSPIKCLYFVIFVLALQQFDGNVLGPRILGDTTGLSSFWVLVSITVFGGLFGFAGMLLGVPLFAVLYMLIKEYLEKRLKQKGLPTNTEAYAPVPCEEQASENSDT